MWCVEKLGFRSVRNHPRTFALETLAIKISDRTEYAVVLGTLIGIFSAIYFHFTEFFDATEEDPWCARRRRRRRAGGSVPAAHAGGRG